jgi:hypothetical protein
VFVRDSKLGRVMDIVMLGPRAVGKTSLLASLYDQFPTVVGDTSLALSAKHAQTRNVLQEYREDLGRFAKGLTRDTGIVGNIGLRQYLLGLGTRGRAAQMTLRFTDMPGKLLTEDDSHPDRRTLDSVLPTAGAIFVAVDSPALMERAGVHNEAINKPNHVLEFVRDALAGTGSRLVVIVPLKCEKYAASLAGLRELTAAVKAQYQPMVDAVASAGTPSGVVLTTVQTVGSMHFSRFDELPDGSAREVYRLHKLGASYAPRDIDQPLRWMLRFAVNGFMARNKTFGEKFWDWWTDTDIALTNALRDFGTDCKKDDGFEVLHHHPFLELP